MPFVESSSASAAKMAKSDHAMTHSAVLTGGKQCLERARTRGRRRRCPNCWCPVTVGTSTSIIVPPVATGNSSANAAKSSIRWARARTVQRKRIIRRDRVARRVRECAVDRQVVSVHGS